MVASTQTRTAAGVGGAVTRDQRWHRSPGYAKYLQARSRQHGPGDPNPRRITIALDMAALYGPEVDRELGGVEPMVDQWESGELVPAPEQVEALARLTGFPVNSFYLPDPEPFVGFMCRFGGRGKGCEFVDHRPLAEVIALDPTPGAMVPYQGPPTQDMLW